MRVLILLIQATLVVTAANSPLLAADLDDVQTLINTGKYEEAEAFATEQVERGIWNERWPKILIKTQLILGKAEPALKVYEDAIKRYPTSLSLRLLGVQILRECGRLEEATAANQQILLLMQTAPSRYASRDNLVAMGQYFTSQGEDARQILELFFDRVLDADPTHLGACLASTELALSKNDFKVAASTLKRALEIAPEDPVVHYQLARTWATTDRPRSLESLNTALRLNPRHGPSLLFKAEKAIDGEQYEAAQQLIESLLAINPNHQEAYALQAVLAHLRGEYQQEATLREKALATWSKNPNVDYLIGKKLSDKYRFAEGAAYQRRALEFDATYLPAKFQLAQDLLRLGRDKDGWEIAREVADSDPYNVVAVNLMNLNQRLEKFTTLEANGIILRMSTQEAGIYGQAAMDLLSEAKATLCEKYQIEPKAAVVVEIYPEQKDFAIRTFGLPGGAGFLGVCFGRVITANSPASQGDSPSNWQSVLWHEFCHVVTLEKTKNRMPRWLSEGISVYEERQKDSSWGEKITPIYREMLLDPNLKPVSQLSDAFLSPPSPIHLQFAYFQSSLVIEFLVERYGIESVIGILDALGDGMPISPALEKSIGSLDKLDTEFRDYARSVATAFGTQADWSREAIPEEATPEDFKDILRKSPNHYWAHRSLAENYFQEGRFEDALIHLETLEKLQCFTGETGDPLFLIANARRQLGDLVGEKDALDSYAKLNANSLLTITRLIEIATEKRDWNRVMELAKKFLAVQPLIDTGHLAMIQATEESKRPEQAIQSLRSISLMSPIDPAQIHFQLAKAHHALGQNQEAKRYVILALADAPRYREAQQLLLKIVDTKEASSSNPDSETSADECRIGQPNTVSQRTRGTF